MILKGSYRRGRPARGRARKDGIVVPTTARASSIEVATADALEEVVEAVAGRSEIWVDGGIRRGLDVVTAVALGARGVLVGRPIRGRSRRVARQASSARSRSCEPRL